ncbi:MreB/Mbl protein [Thermostaphylospora chromogena]|uniref:MreB/Mbl protein n=2 Tax=Thermostaphylospora chromogena TaxID=35622 RepID=A0A1H1EMT7_9ACTN|nr:MreB/Mbl protein [Thermostaphylospora chromogena]
MVSRMSGSWRASAEPAAFPPRPKGGADGAGAADPVAGERSLTRGYAALDLGTARTRSLGAGGAAIAERPSSVPADARGASTDGAGSLRPLRHGVVVDQAACNRLVRLVLRDIGLSEAWPLERVLVGVPVAATSSNRQAVRTAVHAVAGCEVTLVEEPLAAAVGIGLDVTDSTPRLLLDVGAGIVEAVVINAGAITDARALQLSATTKEGVPSYAIDSVVTMTSMLLRDVPAHLRPAVRDTGLAVTGGGAAQPRLLRRLRTALRIPVHPAPEPAHATIRGLTRLCRRPSLADRLAGRGR